MLKHILHVGLTVSDLKQSLDFYQNTLGLTFKGQMRMQGEATDKLFHRANTIVDVAYLKGSDHLQSPPIELLCFVSPTVKKAPCDLFQQSISELCFYVENIETTYENLKNKGVEFLSEPQFFDFSKEGLGKSKAVYFKDPDGIILELIEILD